MQAPSNHLLRRIVVWERRHEMETGITGQQEEIVTEEKTAKAMGSGELPVYATPAMIALIEKTAWMSVAGELEEGQGTVGTKLAVEHVSASPLGAHITCKTTLVGVDRRRLLFSVEVSDDAGIIGQGTHERFIVDNEKFVTKAQGKLA